MKHDDFLISYSRNVIARLASDKVMSLVTVLSGPCKVKYIFIFIYLRNSVLKSREHNRQEIHEFQFKYPETKGSLNLSESDTCIIWRRKQIGAFVVFFLFMGRKGRKTSKSKTRYHGTEGFSYIKLLTGLWNTRMYKTRRFR